MDLVGAVSRALCPRGAASLRAAIERFDRLEAVWERALTEVVLARVLARVSREDEALSTLAPAIGTFEGLRATKDLAVARTVLERL